MDLERKEGKEGRNAQLTNKGTPLASMLSIRPKHEVIHDELGLPIKQVVKGDDGAFRALELVLLVDLDHGKISQLRGEGVMCTCQLLLLLQEGFARGEPFVSGDHLLPVSLQTRGRRLKWATFGCMSQRE